MAKTTVFEISSCSSLLAFTSHHKLTTKPGEEWSFVHGLVGLPHFPNLCLGIGGNRTFVGAKSMIVRSARCGDGHTTKPQGAAATVLAYKILLH